jgi:hypothetical protein
MSKIEQPAAVVEIRVPASVYAQLTDEERMFTTDGERYIVTVDPDASADDGVSKDYDADFERRQNG